MTQSQSQLKALGAARNAESPALQGIGDAAGGDRTHDLRIKSPLLCQLSYGGQVRMIAHVR